MATRTNQTSKVILGVVAATSASGEKTIVKRTLSHLNPEVTDAVALSLGGKLGDMQTMVVDSISRQDAATLTE